MTSSYGMFQINVGTCAKATAALSSSMVASTAAASCTAARRVPSTSSSFRRGATASFEAGPRAGTSADSDRRSGKFSATYWWWWWLLSF